MSIKWKQTDPSLTTIEEVVTKRTGKTAAELLNDEKEYKVRGFDLVIEKLEEARKKKTFVTVVGDYDTDGVTSSAGLDSLLSYKNIPHRIRLPKRHSEGYGLNEKIIDEIEDGIIVTIDNGIAAFAAIEKAKKKGLYVIIIDHHQPVIDSDTKAITLPDADIIIDPHAIPGQADFNHYCGAGLMYKLAEEWLGKNHWLLKRLVSFAAIGTVGDVVTLTEDNRKIVQEGLKSMLTRQGRTTGLLKLMQIFYLNNRITAEDIGFSLSPAINACGRLGAPVAPEEAVQSLKLLTFNGGFDEAEEMANKIAGRNLDNEDVSANEMRKKLVKEADKKAEEIIRDEIMFLDAPMIVYIPDINEGIIGIVAGHLTEKYNVPSVVFTNSHKDPDVLKGSGRSIPEVNLKELLDKCATDLLGYGGHPGAAGMSILKSNLDDFRAHMQENIGEFEPETKELTYDLEIKETDIESLIPELDKFGPYGHGNEQPIFLIRNYKLYPRGTSLFNVSGSENEHITFFGSCTKANAFWLREKYEEIGQPKYLNLIGTLDVSYFKGEASYEMKVIDMEAAEEPKKASTLLARRFRQKTEDANNR